MVAINADAPSEGKKPKKGKAGESYGEKVVSLTTAIEASGLTVAQYFNSNFTNEDGRKHAASLIRAIDGGNAALLNTPALPLARRS